MISSWIARHIAVRRVISGIALVTFSTCFIFADAWAAVKVKVPERYAPIGFDNNARLLEPVKKFSPSTFILPPYLGHIGDFRVTPSERTTIQDPRSTIIHIQDAHCDYAAQHKIADIIDYLRGEYGINTVNLEGGKGDYDLSVFTDIKDKRVREKVVDSFVKEGLVNGAEFFAVNNPGRIKLWGVEDTGLYLKNLKVYRKSLGSKKEIGTYLRSIDRILIDLKRHMFSKELLELDEKYTRYKTETIDLKEYLTFLIQKWGLSPARFPGTSASGLSPFLDFPNVYSLYQSLEQEENIDFKKAEHEREELIDRLQKILSNVELEELVLKTVKFGQEMISAADFYAYLLKKAKAINLDLEAFPELQKYILYISTYNAADKLKVMMETNDLENRIREALYENDGQRRLDLLSRNLTLMRNLFDVKLTRQRFEYYKKNRDSFAVKDYISFIDEEAPVYDIVAELDEDVHKLDEYREQMAGFYEYSFKRDEVFLENIKFSDEARGSKFEPQDRRTTILVTGGFHTENLRGLCEKNNVSYVSIIPNFENEAGYENPYFRLLANGPDFIPESPQTSNAGFSLAVAALLTELGIDVYGPRAKVLLPEIVKRLRESPDKDISDISAELGLKAPGFSINSARDTAGENSGQTPPRSMEPVKILGAVLAGAALIGLNILLFALANIAPAWYIFSVPMIASLVGFGFGYEAYRHIKARIHPSNLNKKGERLKNWHKEQQDIITELRKDLNISGDIRILPKQDLPVFTTWWDALKELISPHAPPIIDSDTAAKTIHVTPGMLYDYPYLKQAVLHELSELKTPSETKATRAERKAGIRALPRLAFNLPWAWVRNMPKKKLFVMIMALISACASTTSYFVYKKVEESRILGRVVELKKID
ncbi:MAG: hypothetical protein KJ995_03875, partial [Candidatus Omnitrophica bacterium]|nr:hypothetical protein [Candidatus Omnitrophota bacterium]MBU1851525.1 hypothetical protein [Candidatus Omnitrophota bacterium]